jgi:hypothetical protein
MNYLVCIWQNDRYHVVTIYVEPGEGHQEACDIAHKLAVMLGGSVHRVEAIR